jgi:hypothetical protein
MIELLPCPFCGELVEIKDYTDKPVNCFLLLHRCRVIGPINIKSYSLSTVQIAWNTRTDTLKGAMIEVLAGQLSFYDECINADTDIEPDAKWMDGWIEWARSEALKRLEVQGE